MNSRNVTFHLPFLEGVVVTGREATPALEGSSYATEHLGFLEKNTAKLTGKISVTIDVAIGLVVPITGHVPSIELEVTAPGGAFWVLPHRIQLVS